MRVLNVDLVICDRCMKRFELTADKSMSGYGTLVLRALRGERLSEMGLSPREDRILELIAKGMTNKGIARELGCAEATIKVHIKHLMRKTRVRNRTQAAMLMRQEAAPASTMAPGPEQVTSVVEMTADLCQDCVKELRVFMGNGNGNGGAK